VRLPYCAGGREAFKKEDLSSQKKKGEEEVKLICAEGAKMPSFFGLSYTFLSGRERKGQYENPSRPI